MSRLAGGLFESVRNFAIQTSKNNILIDVHALHDRYSEQDMFSWMPIQPILHEIKGPARFGYSPRLTKAIQRSSPDIIHQHGLWMFPSMVTSNFAAHGVRTMISPHGMLDEWALNNSRYKKRTACLIFEKNNLARAKCIHALCDSEYNDIRRIGLTNPVCIIPNGVDINVDQNNLPPPPWKDLNEANKILLFLGRIHPKKGIYELVDAWIECPEKIKNGWSIVIAGWGDKNHVLNLIRKIDSQDFRKSIHFIGPQYGIDKYACFQNADAFILPSYSEGLPMAVLEAWSFNLPVLMTQQCNLQIGFSNNSAVRIGPRKNGIIEALTKLFLLNINERQDYGYRGRALVEKNYSWPLVSKQMCEVYDWMLGYGNRPDCVIEN